MMRKLLYSFLFFIFLQASSYGQRIWTGATNSNWNIGSNWNTGVVPGTGTDVEIPSVTNYPVVSSTTTCASITFTGNVGMLTVDSGAILNTGAVTMNSSNSSSRNVTILGDGTLSSSSVTVGLTSTNPGSNRTTGLTSTIANFIVSGSLTLNSTRYFLSSNNAEFYLQSGIFDVGGQVVTVNENGANTSTISLATGAQSGTLLLGYNGGTNPFALSGTGTNTINFNGTNSTVNYDRAGNQTVLNTPYNNLVLSVSGVKTFGSAASIAGDLSFSGTATATINATGSTARTITFNGTGQNSGTWGGTGTGAGNIQTTYFNAPATPANKFVTVTAASCTTGYWTGATSTNWSTASNWW